ncbi:hypothetical protein CO656_26140 [Sinorhizobium sp. FG01]|nr:hypothetical protein CO656_26140 [Sinorhizobium sp. FG01]
MTDAMMNEKVLAWAVDRAEIPLDVVAKKINVKPERIVALHLIGVFLSLCGSLAVRHAAAMGGHANENEMVARPRGQSSGYRAR